MLNKTADLINQPFCSALTKQPYWKYWDLYLPFKNRAKNIPETTYELFPNHRRTMSIKSIEKILFHSLEAGCSDPVQWGGGEELYTQMWFLFSQFFDQSIYSF